MLSRLSLVARNGLRPTVRSAILLRSSVPSCQRLKSSISEDPDKGVVVAPGEPATPIGKFYEDVKSELYKKTGETGKLFFAGGLAAYLISKEIYVMNDETFIAFVMLPTMYWIYKMVGPPIGKMLDDYSNDILERLNAAKARNVQDGETRINDERSFQDALQLYQDTVEVMRENNAMALEIEYRKRLHHVNEEIKRRLDFQVEVENTRSRLEQDHMIDWIVKSVVTSITPQQQKDSIKQCIKDLNSMAV